MSMYKQFKTSDEKEIKGIVLQYDGFRITIGRAGGSNQRFNRILKSKSAPHRRAIQTNSLSDNVANDIMRITYAEAVILNWETEVDGKYKKGIEGEDGKALKNVTVENLVKVFEALPDLFDDIKDQASQSAIFRAMENEEDAKN